ncbi:MAG: tetratricopeptide repeat protein [Bryobacteraceae bacterium]
MKRSGVLGVCGALALAAVFVGGASVPPASITIDYPAEGSIFPPDFAAPTFLWRDAAGDAETWLIEVAFSDGSTPLRIQAPGERMRIGEIDPRCVGATNELPKLTPEQAAARTWAPEAGVWAQIKRHSVERPATVTITGLGKGGPVSSGRVSIRTSKDPVGAPVFYRDVPLMPSETERGVIKPLAAPALPLVAWRLRSVSETSSRVVLSGMHICANCHSFSLDGQTLGLDLDGPQNDRGLYAIVSLKPVTTIHNEDMISWRTPQERQTSPDRVGFMSQVSPDGRYVLTRLSGAGQKLRSSYYVSNFKDYRFLQVFYPTRGILAWHNRATGRTQALPGADDPRYVQTDGVWSPDGNYVVFARAEAKDPYPPNGRLAEYANDPLELQMQYDLYRVPFNGGQGGTPAPIAGASRNGMSNTFPKVSPDGRWIVFVKCRNGQLMRPDSQLWIVPSQGGVARRMACNTPLMDSWHSFSPNGRWLVFSSKARSVYTQMFLTHLDENRNDSPAILIENATAANRAVNIPEFVNIAPDGLARIDVPVAGFYRQFDLALELTNKHDYEAALAAWKKAVELNPEDARSQINLGAALARTGQTEAAIAAYRRAAAIDPANPDSYSQLGFTLARQGKPEEAIPVLVKALQLDPADEASQRAFCGALSQSESRTSQAIQFCRLVLAGRPNDVEVQVNLAVALFRAGNGSEAISHLEKAAALAPGDATIQANLGAALAQQGRLVEAAPHLEKALAIEPKSAEAHYNLGTLYYLQRRVREALAEWRQAVLLDPHHVPALNRAALTLAANRDASLRNGAEAVALAERAVGLSGGRDPAILDTLAAAYAEAGRFPEATRTARRALELAKQQRDLHLAQALSIRIALYAAGKPFRENP